VSFVGVRSGSVGTGELRYGSFGFGLVRQASWVQLGYGAFKLRHVMAGMASFVGVRSVTFRWGRPG
jgi:hypothetical protein